MGLEIQTNKTPGQEIRVTRAPQPAMAGFLILMLTLIELVFVYLIFDVVFRVGANSAVTTTPAVLHAPLGGWFDSDQRIISMWLAGLFFNLGVISLLYQRYFMDHVTIAKSRFGKWEDEGVQF